MPVVSSRTASDDGAGKLPPGASPAASPSAMPAADSAAGDANLRVPPGDTQMDAIINGKGVPIPVDTDPLGINGRGGKAVADTSAGAAPARGRSPEPEKAPASGAGGAPATDAGAATADDALAASAAPARVPLPPTRPVVAPTKAGRPLPGLPAEASAGDVFIALSEQKSEDAAKSAYHDLQADSLTFSASSTQTFSVSILAIRASVTASASGRLPKWRPGTSAAAMRLPAATVTSRSTDQGFEKSPHRRPPLAILRSAQLARSATVYLARNGFAMTIISRVVRRVESAFAIVVAASA